jgi:hypothetical protein
MLPSRFITQKKNNINNSFTTSNNPVSFLLMPTFSLKLMVSLLILLMNPFGIRENGQCTRNLGVANAEPLYSNGAHQLVALIAQSLLKPASQKRVFYYLPPSGQMSKIASWADQIEDQQSWSWTSRLHYISTRSWKCGYDQEEDCKNGICVANAITNYSQRLFHPISFPISRFHLTDNNEAVIESADLAYSSYVDQSTSLKFLVHFLGDIHQPLHVGFTADHGGNSIHGTFFGKQMNLHQVWDNGLIDQRINQDFQGSHPDYVDYLTGQARGEWKEKVEEWLDCSKESVEESKSKGVVNVSNDVNATNGTNGMRAERLLSKDKGTTNLNSNESETHDIFSCPDRWARESARLACDYAYTLPDGSHVDNGFELGSEYYERSKQVVDMQLLKAGVRLSAILNDVWKESKNHPNLSSSSSLSPSPPSPTSSPSPNSQLIRPNILHLIDKDSPNLTSNRSIMSLVRRIFIRRSRGGDLGVGGLRSMKKSPQHTRDASTLSFFEKRKATRLLRKRDNVLKANH